MKVTAVYSSDQPTPKKPAPHPRTHVDAELMKNYPGRDLEELDRHNVPVTPGKQDPVAVAALRKGHKPSTKVDVTKVVAKK